jgi:hypothetical protein
MVMGAAGWRATGGAGGAAFTGVSGSAAAASRFWSARSCQSLNPPKPNAAAISTMAHVGTGNLNVAATGAGAGAAGLGAGAAGAGLGGGAVGAGFAVADGLGAGGGALGGGGTATGAGAAAVGGAVANNGGGISTAALFSKITLPSGYTRIMHAPACRVADNRLRAVAGMNDGPRRRPGLLLLRARARGQPEPQYRHE